MERMSDERLAELRELWHGHGPVQTELLDALQAERDEVERLRAELLSPSRGDRVPRSTALLIQTDRNNIQRDRDRLWSECMALRARCTRQGGDPTVEELHRVVYGGYADAPIARALLRAWGEEA